jgi:aminoglycoside/choline kinase family phosphotransferase
LKLAVSDIRPASSDASFRRYFRVHVGDETFIAMDAPPSHEDVHPFIHISGLLRDAGIQAPQIHARNIEQGFLLLCDFGSRSYLDCLDERSADPLYGDAIASLLRMQQLVDTASSNLPPYDETLLRNEMNLFRDWFAGRLLGLDLSEKETAVLDQSWQVLVASALEQPRVCVHRDYHSRNLMVTERDNPGVLDFQDAVVGPVTYDLVSLLRDCYIDWPQDRIDRWMLGFHARAIDAGIIGDVGADRFRRWFDLMGMQRHLKAIGIFSRLKLRDGKSGYIGDIPRTLGYVLEVSGQYTEFAEFRNMLEKRVKPTIEHLLEPAE